MYDCAFQLTTSVRPGFYAVANSIRNSLYDITIAWYRRECRWTAVLQTGERLKGVVAGVIGGTVDLVAQSVEASQAGASCSLAGERGVESKAAESARNFPQESSHAAESTGRGVTEGSYGLQGSTDEHGAGNAIEIGEGGKAAMAQFSGHGNWIKVFEREGRRGDSGLTLQ